MSATAKVPRRPMEYPYTLVSKVTHTSYKMFWNHANWRFKWVTIGYIASIPFFYYIHKALNSPANHEKLRQVREKEHKEHLHHLAHLK